MKFRTLKEIYDNTLKEYGDNKSFSMFEQESLTYSELGVRVDSVVDLLVNAGLSSGDKVVLLSNNMPNWVACYFAVVKSGMIIVPLLPDFSSEEVNKIVEHSEAKAVLISDKLYAKLSKETVDKMNIVIRTVNLGVIASLSDTKPGTITAPETDDLATIIYTSGTTATPKGVMLSHRALCNQVEVNFSIFPIDETAVSLSILPLSHALESSVGMIYPFSRGASATYMDKPPVAANLMPAFKAVRPTFMFIVPLIMEKVFRSQVLSRFNKTKFLRMLYGIKPIRVKIHQIAGKKIYEAFGGRLEYVGIGGARLDALTEQFLRDARFPYAIGYGLTETAPTLISSTPAKTKAQAAGVAAKGIEVRIDNKNPKTGEGEIVVKTPCIMDGYYKNEEATKEVLTEDGWFRTKDLGFIDKDGYVYVKGRVSNMIVGASGENIYPEEIESVINSHSLVTESVVICDHGRLVALVDFDKIELERHFNEFKGNISSRMDDTKRELQEYVNSKVSKFSRLAAVVEQPNGFEKTPTMKIKRYLYAKNNNLKK